MSKQFSYSSIVLRLLHPSFNLIIATFISDGLCHAFAKSAGYAHTKVVLTMDRTIYKDYTCDKRDCPYFAEAIESELITRIIHDLARQRGLAT
ncbi:MAG: hypothetical protein KGZ50_06795 [Peptococcaceae bacterium]|nr:hypothetical protein [Peptococcaceae bacterium]